MAREPQLASAFDQPAGHFGGTFARLPLHFIWIVDCSMSMAFDGKIQALNSAIRKAIPHLQQAAGENPDAQVLVQAIAYSSGAHRDAWWRVPPTPLESFHWTDANVPANVLDRAAMSITGSLGKMLLMPHWSGGDLEKALPMAAEALQSPTVPDLDLPPVVVLFLSGQPAYDFVTGLRELMDQPRGRKAVRIAVAIGQAADLEVLQQFIGNPEIRPLTTSNPEQLVNRIQWVPTTAE